MFFDFDFLLKRILKIWLTQIFAIYIFDNTNNSSIKFRFYYKLINKIVKLLTTRLMTIFFAFFFSVNCEIEWKTKKKKSKPVKLVTLKKSRSMDQFLSLYFSFYIIGKQAKVSIVVTINFETKIAIFIFYLHYILNIILSLALTLWYLVIYQVELYSGSLYRIFSFYSRRTNVCSCCITRA